MQYMVIFKDMNGNEKRETFHMLSSAMFLVRELCEAKVACKFEYVPA